MVLAYKLTGHKGIFHGWSIVREDKDIFAQSMDALMLMLPKLRDGVTSKVSRTI